MSTIKQKLINALLICGQILIIVLIWLFADWLHNHFIGFIPASILGLFILLLLLILGVPSYWFDKGALWLISHIILFFVPLIILVVEYKDFFINEGIRIFIVMCLSSLLVMICITVLIYYLILFLSRNKKSKYKYK